ncbi:MAG: rhodanese-like domain-containing protein [Gammaproteobacteria bacterium]|nr:rhodanese-like domain-containing protein [Gammaproteobacteria bacterium]
MDALIIEPRTLSEMSKPGSLIVDVRPRQSYERGHIPGALCIEPHELVSGIKPATGKLPALPLMEKYLSRIGYSPEQHIVAYDDEGGGWAGRLIWNLHMIGHQATSLLNGGMLAWYKEGLPLDTQTSLPFPTSFNLTIDPAARATLEDVLNSLSDPDTLIWDARSPEEYSGQRVTALRAGHIPGAINLDWQECMDRQRYLRLREDLPALLSSKGLMSGKRLITHCQTHHRSGLTYIIGKSLGLDIRAYDGSWSEWGNTPGLPIEDNKNDS